MARRGKTSNVSAEVRRGDVFWADPDPSLGSGPHPHVVVQDDVFNASRIHTVIVCAITSRASAATEPGNVALEIGEGGLPKASVVVVSQIASIERGRLGERIGSLAPARVDQVLDGLRFQQASFLRGR